MGKHKHNPQAQMIVTDLEDAGKILGEERLYCELCGGEFPLWPPELLTEHCYDAHRATLWPAIAEAWKHYRTDTDLARRANFINTRRAQFLFQVLEHRADLYDKLVVAGVIRASAQG